MVRHIVDYRAPVVLHPVLLKQFFPYLDDDGSGHFQVGRGYDKRGDKTPLLGYFEPWDQQRFDPDEPFIVARPVAQRLPLLPRQPGPLPAQPRRVMAVRRVGRRSRGGLPAHRLRHRVVVDRPPRPAAAPTRGPGRRRRTSIATSPETPSTSPSAPSVGSARAPGGGARRARPRSTGSQVPGSTQDAVTVGEQLDADRPRRRARAPGSTGRQPPHDPGRRPRQRITDALLDDYARTGGQRGPSRARIPTVATLVDLAPARTTSSTGPPPRRRRSAAPGHSAPSTLLHATSGPQRSYCLATVDLATGDGEHGLVRASPDTGFSRAARHRRTARR